MKTKIIYLIISLALLIFSILFILDIDEETPIDTVTTKKILQVSVSTKMLGNHNGYLSLVTTLEPKDSLKVVSSVSGDIVFKSKKFFEGRYVKKGEILVKIDNNAYIVALNEANYKLKEAEYELLKQKKKHLQAKRDWRRLQQNGGEKVSGLALNIPQQNLAKSNLVLAKSLVRSAKKSLDNTIIKAPISGYLIMGDIKNSTHINQADELFKIISNHIMISKIELSPEELALLTPEFKGLSIELESLSSHQKVEAKITHGGEYFNSGLCALFLETNSSKVISGEFVRVYIPTKNIPHSLEVATSSITPDGELWYVDENDTVQNFTAKTIIYKKEGVVVEVPQLTSSQKEWKVVMTPLFTFNKGIRVFPVENEQVK